MKILLKAGAILLILLCIHGEAGNAHTPRLTIRTATVPKPTERRALDKLVREYERTAKVAKSVEVVADFLPDAGVRKLRACTPTERQAWLQFRRLMPAVDRLLRIDVFRNKAILLYSCNASRSDSHSAKNKVVEKISLIKEHGSWKVASEHFGLSNANFAKSFSWLFI